MMTDSTKQQAMFSGPLGRFEKELREAGMKDESIAFYSGRILRAAAEATTLEFYKIAGKEKYVEVGNILDNTKRHIEMDKIFQEKKKTSLVKFQEDLIEKIVADFEAQK